MKKILFVFVILSLGSFMAAAQDDCMLYLSYYQEYYKQGTKTARMEAIPSWRKAYNICKPGTRQNLYVHGAELYRMMIAQTSDPARRASLVDTLITLHKVRAQYYPNYAAKAFSALSRDVNNYLKNDPEKTREILVDVINNQKENSDPSAFVAMMNASVSLFKKGAISAEDVINDYTVSADYFSALQKVDTTQNTRNLRTTFENAFINSKVASCESLVQLFGPRFEQEKDDYEAVSKIVKIMVSSTDDCTDNDLFMNAVTRMNELQPSANSAYYLYRLHAAKHNVEEAVKYLEESIASDELDDETKGQYSYELATFCLKNGQTVKAVDAANKAISFDASLSGKAYMIIGHAWLSLSCGGNEVERRAKYWVAVDYFGRAKAADDSLAEEANKQIGVCSGYFPQTAEAFMYDLQNGQSYSVACGGLRATTTVRTH